MYWSMMVSLMPPSLDRLQRSLVCYIAAATWRNDIFVETWSMASSYRIVPLMVMRYSSSSTLTTSLTNNFSARVFCLALATAFLAIATTAPPSSSSSSLSSR
ncbi:unnamed protein product [Sphagnum troendelagicum]|uniref:Secreted protein n=1 Tax=Sphagnum troendelagicum TaxID=128251 RepID=A0ABP0V3Z9_9BRYO